MRYVAQHTKICPRTAPKHESPRPRNHMRNVKAGSVTSSSREIRRVAISRSVSIVKRVSVSG